uniref:Uncharacterized protein n=1 Tax=Globodera rostochiensis TaxID=31243 RepID=A0A914HMP2_GLORO
MIPDKIFLRPRQQQLPSHPPIISAKQPDWPRETNCGLIMGVGIGVHSWEPTTHRSSASINCCAHHNCTNFHYFDFNSAFVPMLYAVLSGLSECTSLSTATDKHRTSTHATVSKFTNCATAVGAKASKVFRTRNISISF